MITNAELRELVRGLDEYDKNTIEYLATSNVSVSLLKRVAESLKRVAK